MNKIERIYILLPIKDCEDTIERCLDSIVNQSLFKKNKDLEKLLILVHNNHSDNTKETSKQYFDNNLFEHIHLVEDKKGITPTLNRGLDYIKNQLHIYGLNFDNSWISRIDGDDYWDLTKLEKQYHFILNNNIDILGTGMNLIYNNSKIGELIHSENHENIIEQFKKADNGIAHPSVIFKTSILKEIGGYDNIFPLAEDMWFWIKAILRNYKFANLQETLVNYNWTPPKENYTVLNPQIQAHILNLIQSKLK